MNPRVFPSGARLPSAAIAVAMVIGSAALADPLPVRDAATVALLEQLQERDMPDVMLWVLDRVAADPKASADLKKQLPFRRASALVATTRTELDAAKRAAILDEAEKEIDRFLITGPEGRPAIDAFSQKGNLLIRRGQSKVEAAKRPGADAKALRAEAVGFFDGAVKALQGTVKRGQPVEKVTNAEDAVIKSLDAVEKRIAAIKPAKPGDDPKTPKTKPSSVSAATEKELQQLEDEQEALETKLVQTRLMTAETLFEKAKAFEPQSAEWQAALEESTKLHRDVADKYTNKGAGLFARYYQGRNLALLGKRQDAVSALSSVYAIDSPQPLIAALRAKSLAVALECWLAEKQYDQPDDAAMKFIVTPVKNTKKLDADWLAMKYRGALLLLAKADALPDGEKAKKGLLQKDALSLAVEVATANRDFAKEARELAAKLGKTVPKGPQEENSFAKAAADAGLKVATMKAKQAEAKELQAAGKQEEGQAALAAAAAARDEALAAYDAAFKLAEDGKADPNAVGAARSTVTFLLYDAKRFREAADMGSMLAEKFSDSLGSRQAGKIALVALQQLSKDADAGKEARQKLITLAEFMAAKWPNESEGGDALTMIVGIALETRNPEQILAALKKLPASSPRRPELLQRAGAALWREVQEKRRLEEALRPDEQTLAALKDQAKGVLDEGLAAAASAPPTKFSVAAALSRGQIALEDGDLNRAGQILENPAYGPWAVVRSGNADFTQGSLAEGSLTVALRYFIQSQQVEKAQEAMELLEKTAGDADKLTSLYFSMGRDLEGQLQALAAQSADPAVRERAGKVLAGFESFLDRLVQRDDRIASQMWVATTYMSLGSGKGTGAVVPQDKAQSYRARAAGVYEGLLKKGGEEIATFEPSIRLRMAGIFRDQGKWDKAQEQIDWILADTKRQNSLDAQVQAAELLTAAGRDAATKDPETANKMLLAATVGRKDGGVVLWGWNGIANKISKQVGSGGKADEIFYTARLSIPQCMLDRSRLSSTDAKKKTELLDQAKKSVSVTRTLYPSMGGESTEKQFDKLLKEVQKAQGLPPRGFEELDEQRAQPVTTGAPGT